MIERTTQENELAAEALEDLFYPQYVPEYERPCSECGEDKLHRSMCSRRSRTMFKGWARYVKKNKIIEGKCDRKDCNKEAEMRIRLNVWGSIAEFDTCHEHGTHGGKSRDGSLCDGV